jgi:hypothetical protein
MDKPDVCISTDPVPFDKDKKYSDLLKELDNLVNRLSMENCSNTPDFILASYLVQCLEAFDAAVNSRETYYGRKL